MGFLDYQSSYEIYFGAHLKHSSLVPSADVKLIAKDLVYVMPWQCMFALSMCTSYKLVDEAGAYSTLG